MRALMISDDPERKSFAQMLGLKKEIQNLHRKVDLFTFSKAGILLNQEHFAKEQGMVAESLERLLRGKTYSEIIISLSLKNLRTLFPVEEDVVDTIEEISPETSVFIFGASSILQRLAKRKAPNVFLYYRPGVSKLTREFKNDVISHIERKRQMITP